MENNKITVSQFLAISAVACLSPATRMMPIVAANTAKQAGWVSVLLGTVCLLVLYAIHGAIFRRGDAGPAGLGDAFELAFGKIPSKALIAFYLLWTSYIYLLYIRYYAERMLSTIFTTTDIRFFLAVMMAMVLLALRGRVKVLARFSEISILVFVVVLVLLVAGIMPNFKLKNVWPVTHLDAVPVLEASFQIMGALGLMTLFFFFGEFINDKDALWKKGRRTALMLGAVLTVITLVCLGTLSYRVVANTPMPFFSAAKLISIVEPLDRIEALLFSVWVISDFVIITSMAIIMGSLAKRLFGTMETQCFAAPLALFGYVGGLALASSVFELESFSKSVIAPVLNLIIGYTIPFITLITGKLRKRF